MRYGTVIEDLIMMVEKTERVSLTGDWEANLMRPAAGANSASALRESTNVREWNAETLDFVYSLQELERAVIGVA